MSACCGAAALAQAPERCWRGWRNYHSGSRGGRIDLDPSGPGAGFGSPTPTQGRTRTRRRCHEADDGVAAGAVRWRAVGSRWRHGQRGAQSLIKSSASWEQESDRQVPYENGEETSPMSTTSTLLPSSPPAAITRDAEFGWDTAMSRVTLLQLATCAATGIAEPLLGSIDTFWVASLGTTALSALGPNTCVYSAVVAVVAAHGLGTAATRTIAVALEMDERANIKRQVLDENEEHASVMTTTHTGSTMVAVVCTALGLGLGCTAALLLAPRFVPRAVTLIGSSPGL